MRLVTIHASEGYQIRQLLAVIDMLEETQLGTITNNEHRYAGTQKDGVKGRKVSFVTPLQHADLVAHFQHTAAASSTIIQGDLHLTYTAQADPYQALLNKQGALLPSVLQATPF